MNKLTRPPDIPSHLPPMPPRRSVADWFADQASQAPDWAAIDALRARCPWLLP